MLVMAIGLTAAACSSNEDTHSKDAGATLAALAIIDGTGFHDIDESLRKPTPEIEPDWGSRVSHARVAAAAITWPKDVQPKADTFVKLATDFAKALTEDDTKTAVLQTNDAHAAYHALSTAAWEALGDEAGVTPHGH
jgi:hypothetical protein